MQNWLLVILILFVQEVVALNALIFQTDQGRYNVWAIHGIFLAATIIDIYVGYRIGHIAKHKWSKGKVLTFVEKMTARFDKAVTISGRKFAIVVLGSLSFPYLNAFIAAWLNMTMKESFFLLVLGNIISYAVGWALVLGVGAVIPNPLIAMPVLIGVSVLLIIISRRIKT